MLIREGLNPIAPGTKREAMRILEDFRKNDSGNFALTFGLCLIPLFMAAGLAFDYTRVSTDKSKLQDKLDAAILMASREINTLSQSDLKSKIENYLKASLPKDEFDRLSGLNVNVNTTQGTFHVSLNSYTPTSVMGITGTDKMDYTLSASTKTGLGNIEIALVLDNTYSMSADGKMTALKSSATNFINTLLDGPTTAGKVKMALVPFTRYVNVGMGNRKASWINVPDDYTKTKQITQKVVVPGSCKEVPRYVDGVESGTKQQCQYTDGPVVDEDWNYVWNGCVGSRQQPLNLQDSNYGTRVPGVLFRDKWSDWNCTQEIMPLTNTKSDLLNHINAMKPEGETYIPAGVVWGWRAISMKAPFNEGKNPSTSQVEKIMVLMTDGDNQVSASLPNHPYHWNNDIAEANDWTETACTNAKNDGITVYTISFGTGIATETKNLLTNCATSTQHYFDAKSSAELNNAFIAILNKIGQMRLSS